MNDLRLFVCRHKEYKHVFLEHHGFKIFEGTMNILEAINNFDLTDVKDFEECQREAPERTVSVTLRKEYKDDDGFTGVLIKTEKFYIKDFEIVELGLKETNE